MYEVCTVTDRSVWLHIRLKSLYFARTLIILLSHLLKFIWIPPTVYCTSTEHIVINFMWRLCWALGPELNFSHV
jgi:hypothetical protein